MQMLRKKLMGALVGLTMLLTGGLVVAAPSAAMAQPLGCISGQFCAYTGEWYSGSVGNFPWSINGGYKCVAFPSPWSTSTTSVFNDLGSGIQVYVYETAVCTGEVRIIGNKTGRSFGGTIMDNNIRSFRMMG